MKCTSSMLYKLAVGAVVAHLHNLWENMLEALEALKEVGLANAIAEDQQGNAVSNIVLPVALSCCIYSTGSQFLN